MRGRAEHRPLGWQEVGSCDYCHAQPRNATTASARQTASPREWERVPEDSGLMGGKRGKSSTLARVRDEVLSVLAERVEVETVEERPGSLVIITIRLPDGITEQVLLATQEWVQLQLIDLESAPAFDGLLCVPRYL